MKYILRYYDTDVASFEVTGISFKNLKLYKPNLLVHLRASGKTESEFVHSFLLSRLGLTQVLDYVLEDELDNTFALNTEDGFWVVPRSWSDINYKFLLYQVHAYPKADYNFGRPEIEPRLAGMQDKWFDSGYLLKGDFMGGEAIVETLISSFLESCNEDRFVKYNLINSNVCASESFLDKVSFIPMRRVITDFWIPKTQPEFYQKVMTANKRYELDKQLNNLFSSWYSKFYEPLDPRKRADLIVKIAKDYGVSSLSYQNYLSRMVVLDGIFANPDRHFANFGVGYNYKTNRKVVPPLFDQGMALGVYQDRSREMGKQHLKFQPFSVSKDRNISALPYYHFKFSVTKLVNLLNKLDALDKKIIMSSVYWQRFIFALDKVFPKDCKGLPTFQTLNDKFKGYYDK